MSDLRTRLEEAARRSCGGAHAPYSGFMLGAAVAAQDGSIHGGCNVENASYGLTSCAERNALSAARAAGSRDFSALLIYAAGEKLFQPCGACRQVMAELMPPDAVVISCCDSGEQQWTVAELLPDAFFLRE